MSFASGAPVKKMMPPPGILSSAGNQTSHRRNITIVAIAAPHNNFAKVDEAVDAMMAQLYLRSFRCTAECRLNLGRESL